MIIYLLRHGQAEYQRTTDEARNLTPRGIAATRQVLSARAAALASVDRLWVSPLVRAQQTADIAQSFVAATERHTTPLLIPESDPQLLIHSLYEASVKDAILLVSHQPLVSRLLAALCGRSEGFYPMDTSSLAAVKIDPVAAGLGELLWLDHAPHG